MSPERSPVFTRSGDLPGVATSARAEGTERTIETVEVRTLQAFDRLRPAWDALVERLDLPSPFHSWEWNRRWWDHFGTGKRLRLLLFNRGRSLIGIAQFYERDVDARLKTLASVIEPVMIVVLGVIVGYIAVSIITPIYSLVGSVK